MLKKTTLNRDEPNDLSGGSGFDCDLMVGRGGSGRDGLSRPSFPNTTPHRGQDASVVSNSHFGHFTGASPESRYVFDDDLSGFGKVRLRTNGFDGVG